MVKEILDVVSSLLNVKNSLSDPNAQPNTCTQEGWINENVSHYDWYYNTYPVLNDFGVPLPIPYELLQDFYLRDMDDRNLTPINEFLNCYDYLFQYLIGRLTDTIKVEGSTWLGYTWENLPDAFGKTFSDIGKSIKNPFGIPSVVWIVGGGLLLWKVLK